MDEHGVQAKEIVNAKNKPIAGEEAMRLAKKADHVWAAKGKTFLSFSIRRGVLQGDATEEDLRKAILGPSGNLRAPTLWVGTTLVVGFHPDMYAQGL